MEERKKTMNILRLSEEKTRTIYETASEGILTAEIKTDTITNVNAAICNMSGYDKEELIGMMIQDIVSSASFENVMAEFKALKKGEKNIIVDIPLKKKNGKIIYIDISTSKAVLNGKKCLICFITDITEKKRIKEEEDKIARLESLSHLSAGIAHDFNNYLAGILGNISLLKLNIVSGSDNHRLLNEMEHITMIATNLTNRLLDFSKGGSISIMKQFELSEMLKTTADFSLSGSDIKLDLEISKDIWDISGDSSQLGRVIGNILINGQQAMPVGGRISFKANNIHLEEKEISDLRKGKYVKISIKDTGIGIKKTDLNFIFDPFFTTKQMGSGLGLASVYSIIKNHKGYIQVESESGKGTVFTIYLPALGTKFTPAKKSTGKDIIGKGKILFMDDQDFLRESVSKILTKFGHEVITSSDGEEAVKLFKKELHSKHPFDIVILDMTVPGGKGGEWTIKKLTAISPYVKAIVSSGYSDIPVMSNPKKYGFKAAVKKPFDVYELAKTVKKVMEG
jgi:PAS domain S-box-containing protein